MVLAGTFLNFDEEIRRIRLNMVLNVESMVSGDPAVDCRGKHVMITATDGEQKVATIFQELMGTTVCLKTEDGLCVDFTELNTDDMVAIYEFLFNEYYPDKEV